MEVISNIRNLLILYFAHFNYHRYGKNNYDLKFAPFTIGNIGNKKLSKAGTLVIITIIILQPTVLM